MPIAAYIPVTKFNITGDYAIKRGSEWYFLVNWNSREGDVDTPVNLANASARMEIRRREGDTVIAEFDSDNDSSSILGEIIIDPDLGTLLLHAPFAYTELMTAGDYEYDLEITLTDTAGDTVRFALLEGEIEIKPNITEE
jgi:hypothetical protein